jgi:methyl-accepting chemotaxis protein
MSLKSIRSKIMALTLIAILATVLVQLIIANVSLANLTFKSQSIVQQHVLNEVKSGLKNTVDSMVSSLTDMYKSNAGTIPEAQLIELIRKTLDASRYGEAGYFFAYRYDGTRVVAPENKSQEGQNLWDLTDKSGKKVVQEFIRVAQNGGGFVSYIWLNPKTNKEEEKISYIAPLKLGNFELAVGTGTYLSMVEVAKNDVAREIAQSRKALSSSLVIISIIVLLILAVITYFFTRTITTPLILAVDDLGLIANGDFTRPVPEKYLRMKDEIGKLARAVDRLQANLRPLLSGLRDDAKTLAGNSENLSASSEEIASSSGEVAKAIQQVAAGASDQSSHLQEILGLVENITANLEKVYTELSHVKTNSEETSRLAGVGKKELDVLIASIKGVHEAFKVVAEKLTSLSGSVNQIGEILEVINGIAEQTNLLALNAAIEAARAGEAGRGFAVVAEEVRKLAEQSSASSDKIRVLLNTIGSETNEVVHTSEEVSKQVVTQLENVENTVKAFDDILEAVAAIAPMIEATYREVDSTVKAKDVLLDRVQSVSAVSEEASASAEEISASAEELSASTQEIAASAQQVLEVAKRLEEQVARFKV